MLILFVDPPAIVYNTLCTIYKMSGRSLSVYRHECFARVSLYTNKERTQIL